MRSNKKIKLIIFLLIFLLVIGGSYLYLSNRPRNLNVLLITIDALRPDHLGCYGYKRNTSPNIDKLTKEGVLFTQAISQAPYTAASIAAIFTSTLPRKHGISEFYESLDNENITLAEILGSYGFRTKAVTSNFIVTERRGFEQGFDSYEFKGGELDVTPVAIKWIEENKGKPFFIWLHIMEPHAPYNPPEPYNKLYINDNLNKKTRKLNIVNDEKGFKGIPKHVVKEGILDANYYISQYDGEINSADSQVGTLLNKLKDLALIDKTFFILTADHGEELGEHGYYFSHGATLYDTAIKVPLIMRLPHLNTKNTVINVQVRTLDIMPTILDVLGIRTNNKIEGVSLLPLILKKNKFSLDAFSYNQDKASVRTPEWKLIYELNNEEYELYNLKKDPEELTNLLNTEKEQFQLLKQKLDSYIKLALPNTKRQKESLDEETKGKLRSLGYLQ